MVTKKDQTDQVYREYATVSDAALILGVSIDTVRRWESAGKLHAKRLDGKNRYFPVDELHRYKSMQPLSTSEVANLLKVSQSTVRRLEDQSLLMPMRNDHGKRLYDRETVDLFLRERAIEPPAVDVSTLLTPQKTKVAFAHVQTPAIPIPRIANETVKTSRVKSLHHSWVRFAQKAIVYAVSVGVLLISMFVFLLIVSPMSMSRLFWLTDPSNTNGEQSRGVIARVFQPFADRALRVVDVINPETRDRVQPVAPVSITQLFTRDENGNITTTAGFSPPSSSYLRIPDSNLVVNLNSSYVQGQKPGTSEGDLALLPITSSHIKDGTIISDDIADGGISLGNLSPEVLAYIGTNQQQPVQQVQQSSGIDGIIAGAGLTGGGSSGTPTISLQTGLSTEIISGGVEVRLGTSATATITSVSGLEVSASGLQLIGGCGVNQILKWSGTEWTCASDIAGGGSFDVQEGGSTVTSPVAAINFNANDFSVTDNVGQANIVIDYANSGIVRRNQNETITSTWSFNNASFGTITAGNWQGSVVGAQYGGTGVNGAGATNGQVLIGNGAGYSLATLGAGAGISVINGAGTISIASALGTSISNAEIDANAVTLGTQTTGNYVASLGALTGLSTTGNSGEGSTPTISVTYGSATNTAVQGNTSLTCATGIGNLTGGGNAITLGTGGTCNAISTNAAVSFGTSVTTPNVTNTGALALSATGGGNNLTLSAGGSIILGGFNCTSFTNGGVLTTNASGVITCDNDDGGAGGSISGSGTTDRVPIYTAANTIGSSWLAQSGATLQLDSGRDFILLGGNITATTFIGALTGNASTASALAANPTDCSANQFATAIIANGNLTCAALTDADVPNTITIDLATVATELAANPSDCSANQFATTIAANGNLTCSVLTDADVPNTITVDLAATATALAVNPSDCSANQFATVIAANGNLTCASLTDGDIPNTITIDLAATATALATNPTDCSANQFANAIAANGNLTCAGITDADVSDTLTASLFVGSGSTTTAIDLGTAEVAGTLTVDKGGTGIASYTVGDLIYASGATTLSKLADVATGSCLVSGGVGVAPAWGSCAAGGGITGSGTLNNLPIFTSSGTLGDSTLSQSGTTLQLASGNDFSLINGTVTANTFIGALTGNASTASALAANPSDCSANQFATTIAANGNLTCAALTDGDIPNTITIDLATTATALATNPSDCSANQFATTIAANGNLTCAGITDADVSDTLTASLFVGSGSTTTAIDLGTAEVSGILADANVSDTLTSSLFVGSGSTTTAIDLATAEVAGNLRASNLQSAAADLGAADVTINLGNTNGAFNTNLTLDGSVTAGSFIGVVTGNASTATALAADPTDCSANQFATTIAANGNLTCAALTDADIPDSITITLAATTTALATNPSDCSPNQFATTIAASGNLTCAALTDGDVPNSITIDLATTATALAANPSDCSTNQFATTIAANGNLTCASLIASNLPGAAADLGAADVTINLGNTNGSFNTNLTLDGTITATTFIGAVTGNASTATALAANPTDCSANQFATAIIASGNLTCAALTDGDIPNTITIDLATTATALAVNPSDCSANQFATTIAANGNLTCAALTDSDIPNSITVDLATTASSLAVNPSDCSANQFATTIAANGNLTCAAITDADVSDTLTASLFVGSGSTTTAIDLATAEVAGNLRASNLQSAAADLGAADVTINLGNTNGSFNTNLILDGTITAASFVGEITGNASTATALAANPTDCSANQFATTIAANGNLTCAALTDGDVPNSITIDLATAATSLASDPTDCSAGQYATTIAATGNLTCATVSEGQVSGVITDVTAGSGLTGGASSGNATLNIGAGNGITVNADDISVIYGSAANTAVQGNTLITCASGTGNLSGGGGSITLGAGGTCGNITTNNAVSFSTSVTTPLVTNAGALVLSTTGANDLTLESGSATVNLNATTVKTTSSLVYDLNNAGNTALSIANNGAGVANLNVVEGSIQTAGSTRITNTGVLQNVSADTGILTSGTLGVARGGTGVNGSSAANGTLLIGNGSGFNLSTLTQSDGITIINAAGSITISSTLGASISNGEIDANAVALGAQTTGNYIATLGVVTGLTTTGNSGEGSSPTLSVDYGSSANTAVQGNTTLTVSAGAGLSGGSTITLGSGGTATLAVQYGSTANSAVQGNTTLTCSSGTGNLTGGGGTVTLGTGGSCGAISTNNAVSFTTNVTTPIVQNAGTLTLGTTATAGADDILFSAAGSEVVRILENGDIRFEKGTNDVTFAVATPGAPATYTFSGATGTVLTGSNYSGTLDATYVNVGEAPAAGDIAGTFSGGLNINNNAVTTAKIADLNVTNGKLLNSSLTVSAGAGLSGGGSVALGASTSLAVVYGSGANTAVQGNTTLTCPSGSGNLTGGGGSITLGTGGSCGAISTNAAVSFATSVTSPLFTNAGVLTLSTTGLNDLTLTSGSSVINLNAATLRTTASLAVEMNSGSNTVLNVTNSGAGAASLSVEGGVTVGNLLTVTTGGFNVTGNSTINGTLSGLTGLTIASGGANITGTVTVVGPVVVGNTFTNTTGSIRWTGADFQGFDGATWQSFTATGGGGTSTGGRVQQSYEMFGTNQAATATTVLTPILIGATATTIASGSTGDIRMSSAGSIRGCAIINSAAVTGGSVSVRFRKNGAQFSATNYCTLNTTNTRTNTQEVPAADITFASGDTVGVQLVSASLAPTTLEHKVTLSVEFGTATTVNGFANGGNAFAANALLGTTDNFSLSLMTNNTTVLSLATSGLATFNGAVTTSGALTVSAGGASISGGLNVNSSGITNPGTISGVGANITGSGALTVGSGGAGNLVLDSASNTLVIAATDTSLQRSAAGTFTIDLNNATVTTLAVNNTGVGSTDLNLVDGTLQTAGTTRLTNTGVLQNITGLTISSGGASIAGGATITGNSTLGGSSSDRLTIVSQILGASPLVFQGATDNAFTTTLAVIDPTANNTITFPNASGTLVLDSRTIQTVANSGLSGGGNLSADRSLSLDINNLSAINTTSNSDYLAVYDSNTLAVKKVSRSDFLQGIIGALVYKGTWNAATNTPIISDGTGTSGDEYVVSVGGTRDLGSGNIVFSTGDFVIHNGTRWEVAASSSDVSSVFGRTGAVNAQGGDYTAAQVTNTPAGTLAATNVQTALNELDTEKLGSLNGLTATSQTFTNDANITISSAGSVHTLGWAGQLSVARGGTGVASFTANGVIYGNNAGVLQVTAAGTSGQLLVANASGVPTFVSASGDITLSATGLTTINVDSVTLATDTVGNYVANMGTLTGLTTTGNTGEGSTPTLSVTYGTSANTAVQGNTSLTCASGTGNLSGGGTVITLGSGGTCGSISIINNPTFSSSVITPTLNSASTLTLVSGGGSDILLDSASGIVSLAADDTTLERIAAGSYTINLNDTADTTLTVTNSGTGLANLSIEGGASFGGNLTVTTGGLTVTGNSSITGTLTGLTGLTVASGGASISGGLNNNSGGITNAGNISGSNSYQSVNNTNLTLDAQGTGSLVFTGYNCTGNSNGGALTANGSGVVACSDDDATLSDARLKKDVVSLENDILDKLKDVRTVNFNFDCENEFFTERILDCRTTQQTGVIAQELAEVFPELVYQAADGYYRVKYDALAIYNLRAVSEIAKMIDSSRNARFGSITVEGTIEANTIRVAQIEGLDYEDRIDNLDARLSLLESGNQGTTIDLENLEVGSLNVSLDLLIGGGLTISGHAQFNGTAFFDKLVTFGDSLLVEGDLSVLGTATYNNNVAGYATINPGQQVVRVTFSQAYSQIPIVNLTLGQGKFAQYSYNNVTTSGFDIVINGPTTEQLQFSWTATSVANPITFVQP